MTLGNIWNIRVSPNNLEALPPVHFSPAELAVFLFCYSLQNLLSQFIDSIYFLLFAVSQLHYYFHLDKRNIQELSNPSNETTKTTLNLCYLRESFILRVFECPTVPHALSSRRL